MTFDEIVTTINSVAIRICQLMALVVIFSGIIKALIIYMKNAFFASQTAESFQKSRVEIGYALSLGLSFLVGASILKTTLAPRWNDIGQLAATIAIRTVLNYFLLQAIDRPSEQPILANLHRDRPEGGNETQPSS
ncbi:MAG: DUF1622 domain-containing protein [Cyanobacteria bacterium J055]|nr:MAG: DUF1622 domain-containing protein [Cyanobacteria bacterium J055]